MMIMSTVKNTLLGLSAMAVMMAWPVGRLAAAQAKVEYYPHGEVAAAFAKGETLAQGSSGHAIYKVLTAMREKPGEVEVHSLDTDIMYIVKGTATFITGGTVIGGKHTASDEIRGQSIKGGTPHHLGPGDIIIIPHGIPHWYEAVQPPFFYLVIKVR
jgi:mannose-6-phosphate isomerase-like protein (cupin superfamily)